jgi:outer membrane protein assembly factor BamB
VTGHDLRTGLQIWTAPLRGARIAATADGRTIVAVADDTLTLLDRAGKQLWQVGLPAALANAMPDRLTIDGDTAFVTFRDRAPAGPLDVDVAAFRLGT